MKKFKKVSAMMIAVCFMLISAPYVDGREVVQNQEIDAVLSMDYSRYPLSVQEALLRDTIDRINAALKDKDLRVTLNYDNEEVFQIRITAKTEEAADAAAGLVAEITKIVRDSGGSYTVSELIPVEEFGSNSKGGQENLDSGGGQPPTGGETRPPPPPPCTDGACGGGAVLTAAEIVVDIAAPKVGLAWKIIKKVWHWLFH